MIVACKVRQSIGGPPVSAVALMGSDSPDDASAVIWLTTKEVSGGNGEVIIVPRDLEPDDYVTLLDNGFTIRLADQSTDDEG